VLHSVDIESGEVHERLHQSPDSVLGGVVFPDNRWLYFSGAMDETDIWLLTLN
jgi:hypothetical protein